MSNVTVFCGLLVTILLWRHLAMHIVYLCLGEGAITTCCFFLLFTAVGLNVTSRHISNFCNHILDAYVLCIIIFFNVIPWRIITRAQLGTVQRNLCCSILLQTQAFLTEYKWRTPPYCFIVPYTAVSVIYGKHCCTYLSWQHLATILDSASIVNVPDSAQWDSVEAFFSLDFWAAAHAQLFVLYLNTLPWWGTGVRHSSPL